MNFDNVKQVEKSITIRPPQCAGLKQSMGLKSAFFGFFQRSKIFPYPSVINAEKLIGSGSHIDIIRLAFGAFFIHEQIYGIVRFDFNQYIHDLEESFSQHGRTVFGSMYAFLGIIARIVDTGIRAGKCRDSVFVDKTYDISDLVHKLRTQRRSYVLHRHGNWIFRQLGGGLFIRVRCCSTVCHAVFNW